MSEDGTTHGRLTDPGSASANLEMLQGLVVAPGMVVVALLMLAAATPVPLLSSTAGPAVVVVLGVAATLVAAHAARRYRAAYGVVRRAPRLGGRYAAATCCALAGAYLVRLPDLATDTSPEGAVVSVVTMLFGRRSGPAAPLIVSVGTLGFVLSVLPLGRWTGGPGHPFSHMAVLLMVAALVQLVVAVRCHLVLRQALGGAPRGRP